jgi:hypothetical protein
MNWDEIQSLLRTLVERSKAGKVNWQQQPVDDPAKTAAPIEYVVQLPDATLSVSNYWPFKGQETIRIRLGGPDGIRLFDVQALKGSDNWELFKEMLDAAENSVIPNSGTLVKELITAVQNSESVGLTHEDAERQMASQFFAIVEGDWYLRYGDTRTFQGQERLRIHPDGRYDIEVGGGYVHAFNLTRVRFDPITMHVSFNKVFSGAYEPAKRPAGQIHSREILDIAPDKAAMVGYSERFRHPLIYQRMAKPRVEGQPTGMRLDLDNGHAVVIHLDRPDLFRLAELMDGRDIRTVKIGDPVWFKSPAKVVKITYSDKTK